LSHCDRSSVHWTQQLLRNLRRAIHSFEPFHIYGLKRCRDYSEFKRLTCGIEKATNPTGSHLEFDQKGGRVYVYANATGVDGEARMMFDGSSMIVANGKVLEQGAQFSLKDVEVTTATFDIEEVRSFRSSISRNVQAAAQPEYERHRV